MKQSRTKHTFLWNYFCRENNDDKLAKCNLCLRNLSYKTTITNLKQHLKLKHERAFDELIRDTNIARHGLKNTKVRRTASMTAETSQKSSFRQVVDDSSSLPNKFDAEIWGQFEVEKHGDTTAHCAICNNTVKNTVEDMEKHLKEYHLADTKETKVNTKHDSSDSDSAETFTEYVYVEDKKPKTPFKLKRSSFERTEKKHEGRDSLETRKEISSFLNYISVLLEKVDSESLPELQGDIINMILSRRKKEKITSSATVQEMSPLPVQ